VDISFGGSISSSRNSLALCSKRRTDASVRLEERGCRRSRRVVPEEAIVMDHSSANRVLVEWPGRTLADSAKCSCSETIVLCLNLSGSDHRACKQ
jgi:hypothetical protein